MDIEWDPAKAASNLVKHGVAFHVAHTLDWEHALVAATFNHDGGEPRLAALAPAGALLHAMVFTLETGTLRVISLRRANNREIKRYEREA